MRKTSNLLIRQGSKKSSRENPQAITNTSFKSRQSKDSKKTSNHYQIQIQKQMIRAQNLNEKEQQEIQSEARRTVTKKIKMTENKIESQIVEMLERQCSKLGVQLEREKMDNQKLKVEIEKLRKNIQTLNEKLQKSYNDKTHLSKNQIDGKIQNKHLSEQVQNLRNMLKSKQNQIEYLQTQKETIVGSMKSQVIQLKQTIQKLSINNKNLKEEKQEIEEELEQRTKEAQYLRQSFQSKKKQWDAEKRQFQSNVRSNMQKKGQKITKFQVDVQKLQQKLKQEQGLRKKLTQKNKQLQKQLNEQVQTKKQFQEQITSYKKRVNDLSILKSSNNAIMNQKIAKIVQENQKLKSQLEEIKTGVKPEKSIEKPVLFGADDFD